MGRPENFNLQAEQLRQHVLRTYLSLRLGMSLIAYAFPLLLPFGLMLSNSQIAAYPDSMSAYYHTEMRNFFVGFLLIIGTLLCLYKGYNRIENLTLNFAGICAWGIALFPIRLPENYQQQGLILFSNELKRLPDEAALQPPQLEAVMDRAFPLFSKCKITFISMTPCT